MPRLLCHHLQVPVSSVSVRERLLVREVPGYPSLVQVSHKCVLQSSYRLAAA